MGGGHLGSDATGHVERNLRDRLLALHASIDGESLWRAGVALLRAAMPAYHYLMALPTEGMQPFMLRTTLPVPDEPDYWERLARVAPLEGLLKRMVGRKVSRLSDDVPFFLLRLSPFYRKFMKPEGWRYSAGMFFWDGDRFLGQFAQNRTPEQGDFTDAEMAVLAHLYDHFDTAIRRVISFDRERSARITLEESLRNSPLGTAVLDWDLNLVYHNLSAAEASAEWELGRAKARALKPSFYLPSNIRAACLELRQTAVWGTRDPQTVAFNGEKVVRHPERHGDEVRLRLIAGPDSPLAKPRILVEFRSAPSDTHPTDAAVLLARLTSTERAVARCVARGMENDAIAAELGITRNTVRTHLRSIFQKLSVNNRTQLALKFRE
jgi:DNA-binding CsgD family transcriptional regulator